MSTITGVAGTATFTGGSEPVASTDLNVVSWTATIAGDILDYSSFASTHNSKLPIRGLYDLKGSCQGVLLRAATCSKLLGSMATVNHVPDTTFTLQTQSGDTYTFTGIVSEVAIDTPKNERIMVTMTFESSGEVAVNG